MDYFLDINVLLALDFDLHTHHMRANTFVESLTGHFTLGICRVTQQGYLRLATTSSVFKSCGISQFSNVDAVNAYRSIAANPNVRQLIEPPNMEPLWLRLAARDTASPKVWMDAYLAAFAIAANLELVTLDKDFLSYVPEGLELEVL